PLKNTLLTLNFALGGKQLLGTWIEILQMVMMLKVAEYLQVHNHPFIQRENKFE
ncbi:hypothetical protein FQA39_LY18777, partial [Lamprigera yunnana]